MSGFLQKRKNNGIRIMLLLQQQQYIYMVIFVSSLLTLCSCFERLLSSSLAGRLYFLPKRRPEQQQNFVDTLLKFSENQYTRRRHSIQTLPSYGGLTLYGHLKIHLPFVFAEKQIHFENLNHLHLA